METKKREFDAEVENNVLMNFSENALAGKINMSIENLYSKCQELTRRIKRGKMEKVEISKKISHKDKRALEKTNRFTVVEDQEDKLIYIAHCLEDFGVISSKLKQI